MTKRLNYFINLIIGAFVTCYRTMHLFNELFKQDERILYFDTDLIFFISKPHLFYFG